MREALMMSRIDFAGKPVGVEIVNHAAALVAHEGVLALAGREPADVIRQNAIEKIRRRRAADGDFAHVGDVENAGGVADGQMFLRRCWCIAPAFPSRRNQSVTRRVLVRGIEGGSLHRRRI